MMNLELRHGNLVAGASAEGHGVLVGWSGRGEVTREALLSIADRAGIPREWCPRAKDAAVQLTRAVRAAAGSAYNPEQARKDENTTWASRWMLVSRTVDADVTAGAMFGEVVLVATLLEPAEIGGQEVQIDSSNDGLADAVRREYDARIAAERYVAADVTAWLGDILKYQLDAVRYGGCWYVPRSNRALAESICTTLQEAGWGTNWMAPALPIATSTQLSLGLALGLGMEVDAVLAKLGEDRARARAEGREDIGVRAAETFMVRLRAVGERVIGYSATLGEEHTEFVRMRIHDAMIELDSILEGGVCFEAEWRKVVDARNENGGVIS